MNDKMTLEQFFQQIYPLLVNRVMDRVEKDLVTGKVTAYWAGTIIRIDIKPNHPTTTNSESI